ncbi:MAG TPA: metallophosphoesterase family protein [Thermoleophilaceae bacterium]|nr:metallophosphoesterase family protein [Thermoleophilaceae bacterium]
MLGLLYDVHGNLPALEAVLADCPAERFLLGGDYTAFGAWPTETVDRLRELDAEWIRGNVDRWLVEADDAPKAMLPLIERSREMAGDELCRELAGLPETATRKGTLFCHASPLSDMDSFYPEPQDSDAERLMGVEAERVIFGHTHLQFHRAGPGGIELVNPGSVGMPLDGDHRAAYALLHDDDTIELRRVEYDWRGSAKAVREQVGDLPADRIEQARFDVR